MSHAWISSKSAELRRAFDLAFASPPPAPGEQREDWVAVRVAGRPHALRARELAGLFRQSHLLKLPARQRGLRGVARIRSALVPVYDLGVLLELGPCSQLSPWIAVADQLGFAFDGVEGFLRVGPDGVSGVAVDPRSGLPARTLSAGGQLHPIIELGVFARQLKGSAPEEK